MASQADPIAEPRVPLSRERVLDAAVSLADEHGIESLTMRRLAQELGVEAMTLYYYVKNKDDILNAIVDIVVREFELPPPGAEWKAGIRTTAISAHGVLLRHPWAAGLLLSSSRGQRGSTAIHGVDPQEPPRGGLFSRDDRPCVSRPGQPHHGIHAVAGGDGPGHRRRIRRHGDGLSPGASARRSCPTSPSTSSSTSSRPTRTTRARSRSGST